MLQSGSTSSSKFLEKAKVGIGAYFQRSKEEEDMLQVKVSRCMCTSLLLKGAVQSLLKGSPAQLCNKISIGDRIIAVNGESVHGRSLAGTGAGADAGDLAWTDLSGRISREIVRTNRQCRRMHFQERQGKAKLALLLSAARSETVTEQ